MQKPYSLLVLLASLLLINKQIQAQTIPSEIYFSPDGHMLYTGGTPSTGLYDEAQIRTFEFTFPQANYWNLLTQNYQSKTNLLANLKVDGVAYDSVGIRFKGNTSYQQIQNSQKKSFNISTDFVRPAQDVMGYSTLNLNNCFQDASFMRELYYLHQIRKHIPAAKASYIRLYINGASWGVYPNVQQLNKDYLKEWFMTNDGTNWRADAPTSGGPGPGPGGGWGDGTAALNYLGADTADYQDYYTLKTSDKPQPWDDLVTVCDKLNNTPSGTLTSVLPTYLDVDRTLWFLASEILFTDDDSYVYKGKMDYYAYWEKETGRITPLEFDGNSCMELNFATQWSPFYHQTDVDYPLLNKILGVAEWRQRYLAHMRTLINETFDPTTAIQKIQEYEAMIDTMVQADPKKLYTYNQFISEVDDLETFITTRRNYMLSNTEVAQVAPVITNTAHSFGGTLWAQPIAAQTIPVTAKVTSTNGISGVNLYYANGIVGNFSKTAMYDDGAHNDSLSGDGIYGADIPAQSPGMYVRYYVEAAGNNAAKSVSYSPPGAEHNVYVFLVAPENAADSLVVINEVMASNSVTAADEASEYDDWIELYNRSSQAVDISGYVLTDNPANVDKWAFPAGTILQPGAYLIVWADEDSAQGPYHTNFKLSASGEEVMFLNPQLQIVDRINYSTQTADQGFARIPNGTGSFTIKDATYNANNEFSIGINDVAVNNEMSVYPNPSSSYVYVLLTGDIDGNVEVTNAVGQVVDALPANGALTFNTSYWATGLYTIKYGSQLKKLIVQH
jgi:spore coat protein CotH